MTRHLFLQGDARVGLQIVPPGSVHCCVTSPPYFNQRDYRADGQILYDNGVFTVGGSMTVTDPQQLPAYYKSGVRRGD